MLPKKELNYVVHFTSNNIFFLNSSLLLHQCTYSYWPRYLWVRLTSRKRRMPWQLFFNRNNIVILYVPLFKYRLLVTTPHIRINLYLPANIALIVSMNHRSRAMAPNFSNSFALSLIGSIKYCNTDSVIHTFQHNFTLSAHCSDFNQLKIVLSSKVTIQYAQKLRHTW